MTVVTQVFNPDRVRLSPLVGCKISTGQRAVAVLGPGNCRLDVAMCCCFGRGGGVWFSLHLPLF